MLAIERIGDGGIDMTGDMILDITGDATIDGGGLGDEIVTGDMPVAAACMPSYSAMLKPTQRSE